MSKTRKDTTEKDAQELKEQDWADVLREHLRQFQDKQQGAFENLVEGRKNEIRSSLLDDLDPIFSEATSMGVQNEDVRGYVETEGEDAFVMIKDEIEVNDIMRAFQHLNSTFDEVDLEIEFTDHATDVDGYGHIPSG